MRVQSTYIAILLATMGFAASVNGAEAAPSGGPCGSDVITSGTIGGGGVFIDPFQGSSTSVSGSMTITRLAAASGGGKTQDYGFYLVPETSVPAGSQITYNGVNILNPNPTGVPVSLPAPSSNDLNLQGGNIQAYSGSSPSGYLVVGFSGASQPDTETVNNLQFTLGTLGSLPAGTTTIAFDVYFVCKATGGYTSVTTPTPGPHGAVTISVNTLSALQVSAVGTALDFGELGQTTTGGTPATQLGSAIRVAANGPYNVTLSSANNFVLTYPGGNTSVPNDTIKYNLNFLGQTPGYTGSSASATAFTTRSCSATPTLSGINLPIQAFTDEGGQGKIPSTGYRDTLTITFAPEMATAAGTPCS